MSPISFSGGLEEVHRAAGRWGVEHDRVLEQRLRSLNEHAIERCASEHQRPAVARANQYASRDLMYERFGALAKLSCAQWQRDQPHAGVDVAADPAARVCLLRRRSVLRTRRLPNEQQLRALPRPYRGGPTNRSSRDLLDHSSWLRRGLPVQARDDKESIAKLRGAPAGWAARRNPIPLSCRQAAECRAPLQSLLSRCRCRPSRA